MHLKVKPTYLILIALAVIISLASFSEHYTRLKKTATTPNENGPRLAVNHNGEINIQYDRTAQHSDQNSTQDTETSSVEMVDYFASNGFGKPVSTMQHPAGEYYNGVTYLAYQGPHEDPYVCAYDHASGAWTGPIQAGISALGRTPTPTDPKLIDNHGRPALVIDGQGFIHLFFGGHGGNRDLGTNQLGRVGRGQQIHVVSKNPEDISSWEVLDNISPFGTYSQLIKLSNGHIFLFYRHGSHRSDWVYQKSTDNARTFSSPVSILKHKPQEGDPTVYDTWYAWFQEGPGNTIYASFNYHPCASPGHTSLRLNAYAMKMNVGGEYWENIPGTRLTMPLTKESADQLALIPSAKGEKTRLGTIKLDVMGKPHTYFRNSGKIFYYQWDADAWMDPLIIDMGVNFSDADFLIDTEESVKIVSVVRHDNKEEVCWWNSPDKGDSWEKGRTLISADNAKYVMSALIRNAHPDARFMVAEIPDNPMQVVSKLYLFGDSGPVKRKALEIK